MMSKWIVLLVLAALATCLIAEDADLFAAYQENPSQETYLAAQQQLMDKLAADESDASSRLMLSWLHLMETHRLLEWYNDNTDELKPGERFGWANLMLELGMLEEAAAQYDKLNEASPKWSCPWRHKGESLYRLARYEDALVAIDQAIATRETHYDAYVWKAKILEKMNRDADALAALEKGFTYLGEDIEDPAEEVDDVEVKQLYARLLTANGRDAEAAKVLEGIQE